MSDRNFDDLAERFASIGGGSKGMIRQAVIQRDLTEIGVFDAPPSRMLDAGGGFGWVAQQLALLGTEATVVDISPNMLAIVSGNGQICNSPDRLIGGFRPFKTPRGLIHWCVVMQCWSGLKNLRQC